MTKDELQRLEHKIMDGYRISREEAELLIDVDLSELSEAADRIRLAFLWKCLRCLFCGGC